MLTRLRSAMPALVLFFVAVVTIMASPTFEHCIQQEENGGGQKAQERQSDFFVPLIEPTLRLHRCVGAFIDANDGAITALATVIITMFTIVLAGVSRRQSRLTREAIELARDEFIATHRPRIIIHSFEHSTDVQDRIGVIFTYVNAGASRAKILEIGSKIVPTSGPPRPGIEFDVHKFGDKCLEGGEWDEWPIKSGITEDATIVENQRSQRGFPAAQIMCIGYIRYVDTQGRSRQTGFCRTYDAATRTWLRVENSDYEYAY